MVFCTACDYLVCRETIQNSGNVMFSLIKTPCCSTNPPVIMYAPTAAYSPLCLESLVKESTLREQLVFGSVEPLYKVSPEKVFGRGGDQIHMRGFLGGQLFTESIITTALLLLDSTSSSSMPPSTFLSEPEVDHLSFLNNGRKSWGTGTGYCCAVHLLSRD